MKVGVRGLRLLLLWFKHSEAKKKTNYFSKLLRKVELCVFRTGKAIRTPLKPSNCRQDELKLPCSHFPSLNPIETHQEIQRYQFIYLMSKHFSSTICKQIHLPFKCNNWNSTLTYQQARVHFAYNGDETLWKIYSSYHIKFYCHLLMATKDDAETKRRRKPLDHLRHSILSTLKILSSDFRFIEHWTKCFLILHINFHPYHHNR